MEVEKKIRVKGEIEQKKQLQGCADISEISSSFPNLKRMRELLKICTRHESILIWQINDITVLKGRKEIYAFWFRQKSPNIVIFNQVYIFSAILRV